MKLRNKSVADPVVRITGAEVNQSLALLPLLSCHLFNSASPKI